MSERLTQTTGRVNDGRSQLRETEMMTLATATQWVLDQDDDSEIDATELEAAFLAIMGREPDDEDREDGLFSHLCQMVGAG